MKKWFIVSLFHILKTAFLYDVMRYCEHLTLRIHPPFSLKSVFYVLVLFLLSNCIFPFQFTNNSRLLYFFLLHVTLIFHTAIFRLQSVHYISLCHDSNFHALSKSHKLNPVHSVARTPCACTLNSPATLSASHLTSRSLLLPENGVPVLVRVTFRSSLLRLRSATGGDLKVIH